MASKARAVWVTVVVVAGGLVLSMTTALAGGYPPQPKAPVVPPTLAPVSGPARVVQSKVALTGADILQWVVVAAVVIGAGALLLLVSRRRARANA